MKNTVTTKSCSELSQAECRQYDDNNAPATDAEIALSFFVSVAIVLMIMPFLPLISSRNNTKKEQGLTV